MNNVFAQKIKGTLYRTPRGQNLSWKVENAKITK